jgi:hypothetical protein
MGGGGGSGEGGGERERERERRGGGGMHACMHIAAVRMEEGRDLRHLRVEDNGQCAFFIADQCKPSCVRPHKKGK